MSFDEDKVSKDEQPLPGDYFPKATAFNEKWVKRLGGFDISKDSDWWQALVVTEDTTKNTTKNTRVVRWYRWELKYGNWQPTLALSKVNHLDFVDLKRKIELLKEIYKIK